MNARRVRDIDYQLMPGSDRKTTDIIIERNGTVIVRPPNHYNAEQIDAMIGSKRMWIYRNLAEWQDLNATGVVREWVYGETLFVHGALLSPCISQQSTSRFDAKRRPVIMLTLKIVCTTHIGYGARTPILIAQGPLQQHL